jgi:thiol:disulfide interchange protein
MENSFKPVWFIFAVVLALVGFALVRGKMGPKEAVAWTTDPAAGFERAAGEKKPVLLYFTASWCPPCQKMKSTTFTSPDVAQALRDCVTVKVDIDDDRETAQTHRVRSIPHMKLLSPEGKLIKETGGYMSPEQFILWLKGR